MALREERRCRELFVVATLASVLGCTGTIGDVNDTSVAGTGSGGGGPTGGGSGSTGTGCANLDPGPSPLRRLTRWEYNNTVHDLLGDATAPASQFPPEAEQFGFDNNVEGATLNSLVVQQYEDAAIKLAGAATTATNLPLLLGCNPATVGEDACAASFLKNFGKKAFRRPLAADELTRYQTFYQSSRTAYGFAPAIEMVLRALLLSPSFLYRVELGSQVADATGFVPLTSYEMASRLSYLFWGSMPDDRLLAAAEMGQLTSPAEVSAQAERLLQDPNGARGLQNFYGQWARVNLLANADRGAAFTPDIAARLRTETLTFFDQVIRLGDGKWATALTANNLDPARQTGFMTLGGMMAELAHPGHASPVLRGKFIREQILCAPLPPPPNNVDTSLPPVDPNATERQQLEQKTQTVQPCMSCHGIMNPLGYAFEHFTETGTWRDTDHGLPIDTTGALIGTDVDGAFKSPKDLMTMLASSNQARACVVTEWFRYVNGRDVTADDRCAANALQSLFLKSGGDVRKLLLDFTASPVFTHRHAISGGGP